MSDLNHDVLPLLADAVDELTTARTNREPYTVHDGQQWIGRRHRTDVPSLLDQLEAAVIPGGTGDSGARGVPGSRPTARLDAIDTLLRIDAAAAIWITTHCRQSMRATTADNLRALVGIAPTLTDVQQWDLTREARRWAVWARVTTGWEVPAFRPDNTCPLCAKRGGLRVRVGDGVTSSEASAMCVDCGEAWGPDTVALLAEHIRWENDDTPGERAS